MTLKVQLCINTNIKDSHFNVKEHTILHCLREKLTLQAGEDETLPRKFFSTDILTRELTARLLYPKILDFQTVQSMHLYQRLKPQ